MSRENVEALRRAFESFLAGGRDWGAELLDPEVEWDSSELATPDIAEVYRGPEGVRQFWRGWLAAWETVQFEYELIEADDRVVALIDQRMRGRSTGIEVAVGKYAHVYTFRDGLIVHWKGYESQADALEAVGLSEQEMSQANVEILQRPYESQARQVRDSNERRAMYARVVRHEEGDPEVMRSEAARLTEQMSDAPPEGVPSKGFLLLMDPDGGRSLAINLFETEDDRRRGHEVLEGMSPGGGYGRRVSVEMYEVGADLQWERR